MNDLSTHPAPAHPSATAEPHRPRIGLIGAGRAGRYLLERTAIRAEPPFVAIAECDPERRACVENFTIPVFNDAAALLTLADLDEVLLALPPDRALAVATAAIDASKSVTVVVPLGGDPSAWRQLHERAEQRGLSLRLRSPQPTDTATEWADRFLTDGTLGPLHDVRYLFWDTGLPDSRVYEIAGQLIDAGLWTLLCRTLAELVRWQRLSNSAPFQLETSWVRRRDDGRVIGCGMSLRSPQEIAAVIDLRLDARVSLRTGWVIEGAAASWQPGKLWRRNPDGELIDEHFPPPGTVTEPMTLTREFADELAAFELIVAGLTHATPAT